MYCELLCLLDKDIVVLTANRRLSHHLHRQFNQYQLTQQKKTLWSTPTILPLKTWLANCWQQHPACTGKLLSNFQEQWCWESIIRKSYNPSFFLSAKHTAMLAKGAWETLTLWNIDLDEINAINEEIKTFVQWAQKFKAIKAENGWLCAAELPKALLTLLGNTQFSLPQQIILVGFDEFAPVIQQLIDQMRQYTKVTQYTPTPKVASIHQIQLRDEEHELSTMAQWTKKHYDQNPNQRIGCIIPNLSKIRKIVDRVFTDMFAPHNTLPETNVTLPPFNISAGQTLNSFSIIRCALNVLDIKLNAIAFENLSQLLRSIYINSSTTNACFAALLERDIRKLNQLHIRPTSLLPQLSKLKNIFPKATFPARWEAFLKTYCQGPQQSPNQWTTAFINELTQIGWPGQRNLTSFEYQLVKRFEKIFEEFSELDSFTEPLSRQQALYMLHQLVAQTIFQPESPEQPIQILGVLEATGIEFDALWIMNLSNESWPAAANPNPFLPIDLQRNYKMPHACANREFNYTQHLQNRLFNSAPNIIISSPMQQKDKQISPSRLIHHIPKINLEDLNLPYPKNLVEQIFESRQIESIEDNNAPQLTPHEKIHGGSSILQQQSLCPFRAFATVRLKAQSLCKPQFGLNAAERGTLVHQALEQIWKKLKTQDQLKSTVPTDLKRLVSSTVDAITKNYPLNQVQFLQIESKRLVALLMEWLEFEKTRPPFTVDQRESVRFVDIGDLSLQLKIDRIDKLADNSELIIDYKTSVNNNISDWFGERPQALQLPLYCVHGSQHAFGLAYAQVRSGYMVFKGLIANDNPSNKSFSKITTIEKFNNTNDRFNWRKTLNHWREVLLQLSSQFCLGHAQVEPIDENSACIYCDLQPFCRIGSQNDNK